MIKSYLALTNWWRAFVICCFGQVADILSSMGIHPSEMLYEHNAFARYSDGSFNAARGVILKLWFLAEYLLFSYMLYELGHALPERWRKAISTLPLVWFAYIGFSAAFENCVGRTGWFTAVPQEFHLIFLR